MYISIREFDFQSECKVKYDKLLSKNQNQDNTLIKDLEKQLTQLQNQNHMQSNQHKKEIDSLNQIFQDQKAELEFKLNSQQSIITQLTNENSQLYKQLDDSSNEIDRLSKELSSQKIKSSQQISNLILQVKKAKNENEKYQSQSSSILEMDSIIQQLNIQNYHLEQRVNKYISSDQVKDEKIQSLLDEIQSMQKANEKLNQQLESFHLEFEEARKNWEYEKQVLLKKQKKQHELKLKQEQEMKIQKQQEEEEKLKQIALEQARKKEEQIKAEEQKKYELLQKELLQQQEEQKRLEQEEEDRKKKETNKKSFSEKYTLLRMNGEYESLSKRVIQLEMKMRELDQEYERVVRATQLETDSKKRKEQRHELICILNEVKELSNELCVLVKRQKLMESQQNE